MCIPENTSDSRDIPRYTYSPRKRCITIIYTFRMLKSSDGFIFVHSLGPKLKSLEVFRK